MSLEFRKRLQRRKAQQAPYTEIIAGITQLQAQDPDSQTAHTFQLIRDRPELYEHEVEMQEAHHAMVGEHEGDYRRLSGHPYQVHAEQVAHTVVQLVDLVGRPLTLSTFKAALHHDTWEDGKTQNEERLVRGSDLEAAYLIDAVTRHPIQTDDGEIKPLNHDQAVEKVRVAYETGEEDALVLKAADRLVNVLDQPNVHRPLRREQLVYSHTDEYKKSPYGKWKRLKKRTKGSFAHRLLHDQPVLRGVLFSGIEHTDSAIKQRPRKSFRT